MQGRVRAARQQEVASCSDGPGNGNALAHDEGNVETQPQQASDASRRGGDDRTGGEPAAGQGGGGGEQQPAQAESLRRADGPEDDQENSPGDRPLAQLGPQGRIGPEPDEAEDGEGHDRGGFHPHGQSEQCECYPGPPTQCGGEGGEEEDDHEGVVVRPDDEGEQEHRIHRGYPEHPVDGESAPRSQVRREQDRHDEAEGGQDAVCEDDRVVPERGSDDRRDGPLHGEHDWSIGRERGCPHGVNAHFLPAGYRVDAPAVRVEAVHQEAALRDVGEDVAIEEGQGEQEGCSPQGGCADDRAGGEPGAASGEDVPAEQNPAHEHPCGRHIEQYGSGCDDERVGTGDGKPLHAPQGGGRSQEADPDGAQHDAHRTGEANAGEHAGGDFELRPGGDPGAHFLRQGDFRPHPPRLLGDPGCEPGNEPSIFFLKVEWNRLKF